MPTITTHTDDGYISKQNSSWAGTRDATSGTYNGVQTRNTFAVQASRFASRGGGATFRVYRSFFKFDTSGVTSTVASATFKVRGYSQTAGDVILVKCPHDFGFANADFDNMTGWTTGSSDGSGAGDNESNVTKYSAEVSTWTTNAAMNQIALTSSALSDMVSQDTVVIGLINYDYDLKDIEPTGGNQNGVYFVEYSGTDSDPVIDYTLAATTVSDNAVFFGTNF